MRRLAFIAVAALLLAAAPRPQLAEVRTGDEVLRLFRADARVRVVNVWATWCVPCVAEMPELDELAADFRKDGVEFVGVSLDDAIPGERAERKAMVTRFLAEKRIRFRNVYYVGKTNAIADRFRFDGSIPITLVFDANGRELLRNEGVIHGEGFRRKLEELVRRRKR